MARRTTAWEDTILARDIVSASTQIQSLLLQLDTGEKRLATVIRTLVMFSFYSTTVAGAWGVQRIDIGIGMASAEAFSTASLPSPGISSDKPARGWMYRHSVSVAQNGTGTPVTHHVAVDIRGARKVENGELFVIATSTNRAGTTFTTRWDGLVRCLLKL